MNNKGASDVAVHQFQDASFIYNAFGCVTFLHFLSTMVVFADLEDVDDAPDIRTLVHRFPRNPTTREQEESNDVNRPNPNLNNGFSAALSCYP